jgi:hypothetical protein
MVEALREKMDYLGGLFICGSTGKRQVKENLEH